MVSDFRISTLFRTAIRSMWLFLLSMQALKAILLMAHSTPVLVALTVAALGFPYIKDSSPKADPGVSYWKTVCGEQRQNKERRITELVLDNLTPRYSTSTLLPRTCMTPSSSLTSTSKVPLSTM